MTTELLDERQTLELLAKSEEKIGELYLQYAGLFSEEADFWTKLAKDEAKHARWVRSLLPRVQSEQVTFREERLGSQAFILFYDYLEQRLREIRAQPISLLAALAIAIDAESTLVEKAFYDIFQTTDPKGARTLALLSRSADAHLKLTQERWRQHQQSGTIAHNLQT